jgi:hypothetical protein
MLAKVIMALVAFTLIQFLVAFALTHLGIVVLGASGWFIWSRYATKTRA